MNVGRVSFFEYGHEKGKKKKVANLKYQWCAKNIKPTGHVTVPYRVWEKYKERDYLDIPEDIIPIAKNFVRALMKRNKTYTYLIIHYGPKTERRGILVFQTCF